MSTTALLELAYTPLIQVALCVVIAVVFKQAMKEDPEIEEKVAEPRAAFEPEPAPAPAPAPAEVSTQEIEPAEVSQIEVIAEEDDDDLEVAPATDSNLGILTKDSMHFNKKRMSQKRSIFFWKNRHKSLDVEIAGNADNRFVGDEGETKGERGSSGSWFLCGCCSTEELVKKEIEEDKILEILSNKTKESATSSPPKGTL